MINLADLFPDRIDIITQHGDATFVHHLREPTEAEDLLFRRRSSAIRVEGGKAEPADAAFLAPLKFYDTICERVTVQVGTESEDLPDFKEKISPDIKCSVIAAWQGRFKILPTNSNRNGETPNAEI